MAVVKLQKKTSYYSRLQVSRRRRREGKTDYKQRVILVKEPVSSTAPRKLRLVVRITNQYVICQLVRAQIQGDHVVCQATSKELNKYGISFGLKNYAAAYATGLLLGRRALALRGVTSEELGVIYEDGEMVERDDEAVWEDFAVHADVGLARCKTGVRVFAAARGLNDAGIDIAVGDKALVGYVLPIGTETKGHLDQEMLAKYIFGGHVAEYMDQLSENDTEKLKQHFKAYVQAGADPDSLEEMYQNCHDKIREDPTYTKTPKKEYVYERQGNRITCNGVSWVRDVKLTRTQKRANLIARLEKMVEDA